MTPPAGLVRPALAVYGHLPARLRRRLARLTTPTYTVGALCVILDRDRVLLVRHSYRKHWAAPGGLLDRGELPVQAAVREVGEEVGLAVEPTAAPEVIVLPRLRRIDFAYRCRAVPGTDVATVRASSPEILEARWFPLDALPRLHADTAEAMRVLGITPWPRRPSSEPPSARTGGAASSGPSPRSGEPAPG